MTGRRNDPNFSAIQGSLQNPTQLGPETEEIPTELRSQRAKAAQRARRRALLARGRQSTILGGSTNQSAASVRSLLA